MPLKAGVDRKTREENFHEWRHGKTYQRTKRRHGAKAANRQMQAVVLSNARKTGRKSWKSKHKTRRSRRRTSR